MFGGNLLHLDCMQPWISLHGTHLISRWQRTSSTENSATLLCRLLFACLFFIKQKQHCNQFPSRFTSPGKMALTILPSWEFVCISRAVTAQVSFPTHNLMKVTGQLRQSLGKEIWLMLAAFVLTQKTCQSRMTLYLNDGLWSLSAPWFFVCLPLREVYDVTGSAIHLWMSDHLPPMLGMPILHALFSIWLTMFHCCPSQVQKLTLLLLQWIINGVSTLWQ